MKNPLNAVNYEGKIPKSLRDYAEKHADQIQEITWSDGYDSDRGGAYDAFLRAGWRKCDDYVHTLINDTAAGLIGELKDIVPCDCDDCQKRLSSWLFQLQIGDQVKCLEDEKVGSVIEVGYSAVKVRWEDGMVSCIGKRSNVAGRFQRVC